MYSAEKGQPTRVTHEKCRNRGTTVDDFGLRIEDADVEGVERCGLDVVHLEPEQLAEAAAKAESPHTMAMQRISEFLKAAVEFRGSKTGVLERLRMNRNKFFAAFAELESQGLLQQGKDERGPYVRWVGSAEPTVH